ncbi:MAG TPA: Zn-ribbon domain-containing OB-fold protein [Chloroflexota bacterium]|nr:Zn-ribbon domain-containing OB-fold protein [Chloroflexota bacterium]
MPEATNRLGKPAPVPDPDTRPFWDACRERELRAQRCTRCGRFRWPPQGFCPACYAWEHDWVRLSGRGTVTAFSVVHHSTAPAFKDELPYVVALIALDGTGDRVTITSNVVGCPWEAVAVGMPVEVVFTAISTEAMLPQFRPAAQG